MESALVAFKRPSNEVQEEINSLLSRRWTLSEDLKLKELVAVSGPRKWTQIGKQMQGRTGKTCRSRWFNHLDPRIRNDAFSDEEEKLLIKAYNEWGCQWSRIARLFRGRTDRQMQKLWRKVMKKLKKTSTSIHELIANDKREGFLRDESRKMPQEETTHLEANKYLKETRQYLAHQRHFYNIPTGYLPMSTPHVSISQPSSSSLPSKPEDAFTPHASISQPSSSSLPSKPKDAFTPHVSISQPSSSSSLPSKSEEAKANVLVKYIDFLGVGDS
ncbi:unnamed protein product [Arabidopsis lyrata]|uniref:Myb family transcription factor n=2 Tax=Arabidopsis lyrata subsp. lyrata TaxID=81972 RepID=D7MJE0_ARALL|nr:hypothetical protein ARALYDRAFT_355996 [Arabidopsis lyrata subsp. lyrata]CAH8277595.1 unnamed protein product [Arabidopsis lyrata]